MTIWQNVILQTSLWQFVKFTFTDLGPAFASWARNWYWSLPRKSLIVTPPYEGAPPYPLFIWKGRPPINPEKGTPHLHGGRGYIPCNCNMLKTTETSLKWSRSVLTMSSSVLYLWYVISIVHIYYIYVCVHMYLLII